MKSRGRARQLVVLRCPGDGRPLASTDGRRLYLGSPEQPMAVTNQQVDLNCVRPNCAGHVTWHPARKRSSAARQTSSR